jgi:hypothetical protein
MKKLVLKKLVMPALLVAVPFLMTACATPKPPVAYHATDNSALVIQSLDNTKSQIVGPSATTPLANAQVIADARNLPQHQTAVVILENYNEPTIGTQFRDRGTPWFINLRCLGYEHIVFLQGNGNKDPEGLITLAKYD